MTNLQQTLEKKHGSPAEFEMALLNAVIRGTITLDEMITGVNKYRDEWATAGKAGDYTKVKLRRVGLDKEQIAIVMSLIPKKGDTFGTASDRARNLMDLQAGCGLSEIAVLNNFGDIILKLIGAE